MQESGAWHDDATLAVFGGEGRTHFAPRWSEIHVFPLEIKVPTRPGLERLIGRASVPGLVRGKGQGRAKGFSRGECGAAEPPPVRTVAKQEGGAEGRPRTAGASFPPGGCIFGHPASVGLTSSS